jgi:hypothetical protein
VLPAVEKPASERGGAVGGPTGPAGGAHQAGVAEHADVLAGAAERQVELGGEAGRAVDLLGEGEEHRGAGATEQVADVAKPGGRPTQRAGVDGQEQQTRPGPVDGEVRTGESA